MRPRILVNLAFFAALGVALTVWASMNLLHVDAIERPYQITADFASSPGLHPDLQVTYLGVAVGRVSSVRLEPGMVAVRLDLDRGTKIPAGAGAKVLRKSAIGEPYIELTAPAAAQTGNLAAGAEIPLGRTQGTVDYQHVFDGLGATLRAIDPTDTRIVVHELATGLSGRGDALHDLIGDAHQLTAALAADTGLLDQLSVQLTQLAGTLDEHRAALSAGLGDLAAVVASARGSEQDLVTVLRDGPGFIAKVQTLLQKARPGLDCLLTAAGTPGPPILTPATETKAHHILSLLPTFQALAKDISVVTPQATYLKSTALITLAGPKAAAEYPAPTPKPVVAPATRCPAASGSATTGSGRTPAVDAAATAPPQGTGAATPEASATGRSAAHDLLPLLPIGLAGAVLLAVLVRGAAVVWSAARRTPRP